MVMAESTPAKASTPPVTAPATPPATAAFSPGLMFSQLLVKSAAMINSGRSFDFFILDA
jgi:hypothetical protein